MSEITDGFGREAEAVLGQNVSRLRKVLGLSLRELRERSGVAISLISRVEQGQGTSVRIAAKLAGGLGVPLTSLLDPMEDDFPAGAGQMPTVITVTPEIFAAAMGLTGEAEC